MTPRSQLPESDCELRARQAKVSVWMKQSLVLLEELRYLYGRRRFGELDRALGRKPGFLNIIFAGRERLGFERLIAILDFLGVHPRAFFCRLFPQRRVPAPPIGFLVARKERTRAKTRLAFLEGLTQWAQDVNVSRGGAEFRFDAESLRQVLNVDAAAAFRMAYGSLEGLVAMGPSSVNPVAAETLCRVLNCLADLVRRQGDRNSACDLLDLGFQVEQKLENLALRAYLMRTASYVLADLEFLEDAEYFAEQATRLASLAGDTEGLGRSHYVWGVMLRRLGENEDAVVHLDASLKLLPDSDLTSRAAARFALAYGRLENGDLVRAADEIDAIEKTLPHRAGRDFAKMVLARAEIASQAGDLNSASELFASAAGEFAQAESWPDLALCGLKTMQHSFRHGRLETCRSLAHQLMPLVGQLKDQKDCQALLLETLRIANQGELTLNLLSEAIVRWGRPTRKSRKKGFTH